ncbi:hypothetical protein ACKA04_04425 [Helcococcus kunzii]|uniref:hypothetical protein n=1 Tax=Helcococcus kunzii TaxID=40091 RepID=UPI00389CBAEF
MEITIILLAGIVVGITEIVKQTDINKKVIPFIALAIGILITFIGGDLINIVGWQAKVLTGLVLGLTAMGLYSGGKTLGE